MSVTAARTQQTAEDLERLPSDSRYELIEGELFPMAPPAGPEHGSITYDLAVEAGFYIRQHTLGQGFAAETGFLVARDPDTVLAPDFSFVAKERLPAEWPRGFLPLAPDLVLETRAPGDTKREVADKVTRWLRAGVRLIWELDPKSRELTVYRQDGSPRVLGIDDILSGEDVLPGFTLPIRELFKGCRL